MKIIKSLVCALMCMDIHFVYPQFNVVTKKYLSTTFKPLYGVRSSGQKQNQNPKLPGHHFQFENANFRAPIERANLDILHAYTAPNLSPIKHTNPGGFFSILMNGSEDELDLALSQNAVLDTIADLLAIVGLKDLRDWLGIILMMFLLGPVLIPIIMLPAPTLALGALLVPLIWYSPPSLLNDNIAGHDPRIGVDVARSNDLDASNSTSLLNDFQSSKCIEMFTCEFRVIARKFTSTDPVSRFPKYEEDCSAYYCHFLNPIQRFLRSHYFYIFGDGTQLYND